MKRRIKIMLLLLALAYDSTLPDDDETAVADVGRVEGVVVAIEDDHARRAAAYGIQEKHVPKKINSREMSHYPEWPSCGATARSSSSPADPKGWSG